MQAKTERFEMRLDEGILERIDAWRSAEHDLPSRAEAVRRLIEDGMDRRAPRSPNISDGEKLLLMMLCEFFKHAKVKGEIDPKFIAEVIYGGHFWALEWKYPGIYHRHADRESVVHEVGDVLDMWSFLERGYAKLPKSEKDRVTVNAAPFGGDVTFRGFDGNNESEHMSIARFLVDYLDRFSEFKGRELNSHAPSLPTYRRMLTAFKVIRPSLGRGELNANQIISILTEQIHPDHQPSSQ